MAISWRAPQVAKSNNGTSLLETVVVAPVIATTLLGLLLVVYVGSVRLWLTVQLRELLYCRASHNLATNCTNDFRRARRAFIVWGEVTYPRIHTTAEEWQGQTEWRWQKYSMRIHQKLDLAAMKGGKE